MLAPGEEVDHRDEDKTNDSLENLQVLTGLQNRRKYSASGRALTALVVLKCPMCRRRFEKPKRNTHLVKKASKATFCSLTCARRFWRLSDLPDLAERLKENVVGLLSR